MAVLIGDSDWKSELKEAAIGAVFCVILFGLIIGIIELIGV